MLRRFSLVLLVSLWACSNGHTPADRETDSAPPAAPRAADARAAQEDPRPVVVFLGTSLTAGLGLLRERDTYVSRVAELADSAGVPIRAVNAGVSGETSAGGLRRLDWVLRQPVDLLVLELGANDGLRAQSPEALKANLEAIVDRTRARYPAARIVLAGMEAPPNLGPAYTKQFHDVFPAVARERDLVLIPFLLEGVAGVPELNQSDRIHPNPEGHRIVARHVWTVLEPLVREMWNQAAARADSTSAAGVRR